MVATTPKTLWLSDELAAAILAACPTWQLGTLLVEDESGEPAAAGRLVRDGDRVRLDLGPAPAGLFLLADPPQ